MLLDGPAMLILISAYIGIFGYVWNILNEPGEIFDFWPSFLLRAFNFEKHEKIHKVLYACEKCVAGQLALWSYPILIIGYSWKEHLVIVILSIFFARLVSAIMKLIEMNSIPSRN